MKRTIVVVCGPTAVGKTKYAIEIANALSGEVVSSDSMQLYKFMDIGSAKPTKEEQAMCPHHLVDLIDPREPFSVARFQTLAKDAINDIFNRGKVPVISGGTGLYVNSLIYDMDFSAPPGDEKERKRLYDLAEEHGCEYVHNILAEKDSEAAARIHPNNIKKVIRAIEAADRGQNVPAFENSFVKTGDYDYILIGLTREREELYDRINRRVDILLDMGLEAEVKGLLEMGLGEDDISMKGIGYKELIGYFHGNYDFDEAVRLIKQNTRHLAKRQLTWFRRYPDINWFNISEYENDEKCIEVIIDWLKKKEM